MIFPNVASDEVVNAHLNQIKGLFETSEEGVELWSKLPEQDRITLCQFSDIDTNLATHSIKNFSHVEVKRLRQGTKRLEKLANRFNNISPFDFR